MALKPCVSDIPPLIPRACDHHIQVDIGLENVGQMADYTDDGGEAPGFDGGNFMFFVARDAIADHYIVARADPRIMTGMYIFACTAAATAFNNAIPGGQRQRNARAPR